MKLAVGKISEELLEETVLGAVRPCRTEVVVGPGIGEDCAALMLSSDELLVVSTDPITGTAADIGRLGIRVTLNDLASAGAEPVGVLLTLLLPVGTEEETLSEIMAQVHAVCAEEHIDVIGGHTEVTAVVNQPVISVTGMGRAKRNAMIQTGGARPGMKLVMSKSAGLEGTSILARDLRQVLLKTLPEETLQAAAGFDALLSVLPESRAALKSGVAAMHDVTEGGIRGAVWELAQASGVGVRVFEDRIPVRPETRDICAVLDADPYGLISSGSMLMAAENGERLVSALREAGISAAVIGETTEDGQRLWISPSGEEKSIPAPAADELYRALAANRPR